MIKLIKLAIVIGIVYLVVTQAKPFVERVTEVGDGLSRRSPGVSQGHCLRTADGASESFGREMRNFAKPPFDLDEWDRFLEDWKGQLYEAESACSCPRSSCQRASEALAALSDLVEDFDNSLRGGPPASRVADRMDRVNRLLKRARDLDRQGD